MLPILSKDGIANSAVMPSHSQLWTSNSNAHRLGKVGKLRTFLASPSPLNVDPNSVGVPPPDVGLEGPEALVGRR